MKTAVCIASGPSLTAEDCARAAESGADWIVAVNDSWRLAEGAHAVYAGDFGWWRDHLSEVPAHLQRWTCSESAAHRYKLHHHRVAGRGLYNSGQRAIELCVSVGFERVLLLGFDCSVTRGTHWHGDHASGKNPDAARCREWQAQFAAIDANRAEILNCSRETALTAFPLMTLEAALAL